MIEKIKNIINSPKEELNEIFKQFKIHPDLKDLTIDTLDKFTKASEIIKDTKSPSFPGYFKKLRTDPYWEIILVPTKEQRQLNMRKDLLKIVGEDSRNFKANFNNFELNTEMRKRAFRLSTKILEEMILKEKNNTDNLVTGLYLHSNNFQIGKTYLANAIANELADVNISGIFVFVPNLALQAKDFENVHKLINELKTAKIVVFDDLGAEYRSEWFRLEVLMPVLQYRLSQKLLTIITSNYSILDLRNLYAKNTLEKDVDRLLSRILELTIEVELDG